MTKIRDINQNDFIMFKLSKKNKIKKDTYLYREREKCNNFIWLLEGEFKVFKTSPCGHEITLYRVYSKEPCTLNLHCLLSRDNYFANAIAETESTIILLNKSEFYDLFNNSIELQYYFLQYMSDNLCGIIKLASDVTFKQTNERLSNILGKLFIKSSGAPITTTHIKLAKEIGSTREVVSRNLKILENNKCIVLSRGEIKLLSLKKLKLINL